MTVEMFRYLLLCVLLVWAITATAKTDHSAEFTLGIRDSIMIAHSFKGKEFGPAQNLHGATYTVDVDFITPDLVKGSNWVVDIGDASTMLSEVLSDFNFKNLDELFPTENTTTEFMCKEIHGRLCKKIITKATFRGKLRVKL